jgi:V/A-type H+-transporting ATPase subunit B
MNKVFNRIESIVGNVITVKAKGVRYHELAQINTRFGTSLAEVNKIDGDVVSLQVFAGVPAVQTEEKGLWQRMQDSFLKTVTILSIRAFLKHCAVL